VNEYLKAPITKYGVQAHSAHFNDDFDLYVSSYFEGNRELGICVSSNKEENIDNFVKYWVEQGYLKEIKKED
jgi:hypothetical protein